MVALRAPLLGWIAAFSVRQNNGWASGESEREFLAPFRFETVIPSELDNFQSANRQKNGRVAKCARLCRASLVVAVRRSRTRFGYAFFGGSCAGGPYRCT